MVILPFITLLPPTPHPSKLVNKKFAILVLKQTILLPNSKLANKVS